MLQSFARRRARGAQTRALQKSLGADMHAILGLAEDDVVRVDEITCGAPGCADVETVFLILRQGARTEALKIGVPMTELTERDLCQAVLLYQINLLSDSGHEARE